MEQYLINALDRVHEPLLLLNASGRCLFYNQALASFLGLPVSQKDLDIIHAAWPALSKLVLEPGEAVTYFDRASQEPLRIKLHIEKIGVNEWLVRVLANEQISRSALDFHAERLQTLGMLAGGVAHDFNNILAGILGHTTYLNTILSEVGNHRDSLRAIEDGAKKASVIIQQILNFSRLDAIEKIVACDLVSITQRTCALLRGAIPPDYELIISVPATAVNVLGVEAKIAQIIVNLVINARDALGVSGKIAVNIGTGMPKGMSSTASNMAKIEVSDNGQGMSSETLQRAFEPYFSTKKDKGTGIGLSTVHAIVDFLGGSIDVASKLNHGTTITIYLPLAQFDSGQATKVKPDDARVLSASAGERIMIVDDETPVRNVLSLSLEHLGYHVELASSGMEALELFARPNSNFALIILDMLMPNLSGEEVFFRLRQIDPDIKVLIISGYSSEEAVQHILDNGGKGFIQKPFTISELSKKVRQCLGS
jgi:two-component system, cell cycle sensor histidine kinase and response regulator CckA